MNLSFYCEFHNDIERLHQAVASLRKVYPESPLTLVSDGSTRLGDLRKFDDRTIVVESDRMFTPKSGYSLWERRISTWHNLPGSHVVCFDTDALFHKRFTCEYPTGLPIVYGKLWTRDDNAVGVRGGCYGLTRQAVNNLREKFDPTKLPEVQTYPRPGYEEETIWVDGAGCDVFKQCEVRKRICCDFGVHVKVAPIGNFAVTHPHKNVHQ